MNNQFINKAELDDDILENVSGGFSTDNSNVLEPGTSIKMTNGYGCGTCGQAIGQIVERLGTSSYGGYCYRIVCGNHNCQSVQTGAPRGFGNFSEKFFQVLY